MMKPGSNFWNLAIVEVMDSTVRRLEVSPHCIVEGVRKDGSVTTGKILEADPMSAVGIEKRDLEVAFRILPVVIRLVITVLDLVHLSFCHQNTVATCKC
jgi:hypothetical protein